MASKIPSVSAKDIIKVLKKCGFRLVRQKGSHQIWKHSDGRWTTLPVHPGEDIGRGLFTKILKDVGVSPEEFQRLR